MITYTAGELRVTAYRRHHTTNREKVCFWI